MLLDYLKSHPFTKIGSIPMLIQEELPLEHSHSTQGDKDDTDLHKKELAKEIVKLESEIEGLK